MMIYFRRPGGSGGGFSSNPGEENVLEDVTYYINGILYTGTLSLDFPTAAQIAARVWEETTVGHTTSGTYGFLVKKLLTVAKFLGLK